MKIIKVSLFVLNRDSLHNFYYGKSWAQIQFLFLPDSPKAQKVTTFMADPLATRVLEVLSCFQQE